MSEQLFILAVAALSVSAEVAKPLPDPRILSVYPLSIPASAKSSVAIRGTGLTGASGLVFGDAGIQARVVSVETEPLKPNAKPSDLPVQVLRAEIAAERNPGPYSFRVIARAGTTNETRIWVCEQKLLTEEAAHTEVLGEFPLVLNGRIGAPGEVDRYWLSVSAGDVLTFRTRSGMPAVDPELLIAEATGSWFNPARMNVVASNDEPLHFPGLSNEVQLTRRFEKSGRVAVDLKSFTGQGGPDYTYSLIIDRGFTEPPLLHPPAAKDWDEHAFTRLLSLDWPAAIAMRGEAPAQTSMEPAIFEGRITKPAETLRFPFKVSTSSKIAIEIETPEATLPRFNPVIRVLTPSGEELATNVYTKLNNNGLYMMKMIHAKTIVTLPEAGEYTIEVRDITTDVIADDFRFRMMVRPQIPHVGKAAVAQERVNLMPGQTKPLTVNIDLEEGFDGLVFSSVEGLPAGVTATVAVAAPVDQPPLPNGGRRDRYFAEPFTAKIVLDAASDAPVTATPVPVRVVFQRKQGDKLSDPVLIREVPLMISKASTL